MKSGSCNEGDPVMPIENCITYWLIPPPTLRNGFYQKGMTTCIFFHIFRVLTIQAKSFFDIPIEYSILNRDGSPSQDFTIGLSDGDMKARKQLSYTFDPHQYQLSVTAREPASGFSTTEDVSCIHSYPSSQPCQ